MNEEEHRITEKEYRECFGLDAANDSRAAKALDHALDIRKFEIELYWKRAAYFWTLIAAAFAGYFAILGSEHLKNKEYLAYIVGSIGLLFTWAWFLVNRGSKYWQENWENHVDMLEDKFTGPLYKTVLHRPRIKMLKDFSLGRWLYQRQKQISGSAYLPYVSGLNL
ncbi:RipA family octameric membrane protein [Dissulfurispira sp.]|uniref:RipA family octameric membrane protein n=1 Tax=Dissulfurispira sp. TaxID=2817609 RepID=UPI002FD99494